MQQYNYTVTWSGEDEGYIALCVEFPTISGFGTRPEQAMTELQVALEAAIDVYREEGWDIPEPNQYIEYSGKFPLRLPKALHGRLAARADVEGVSLNTFILTLLSEGIGLANGTARSVRIINEAVHGLTSVAKQTIAAIGHIRQEASATRGTVRFSSVDLHYTDDRSQASSNIRYLKVRKLSGSHKR